uniref:tRNA (Adenosine(37)-N6)-threonylcarbamoyltransferase complex dimerization subunit type 1 TsaB n=1 Tax=Caldimicrobium thiodismutans TaxID=1653476 RepID=A0A832LVU4_9BACT
MEAPLILALETSGKTGGIALYKETLLGEINFSAKESYSKILFQNIPLLLERCGLKFEDIKLIAVDIGPGSFTGLRIGLSLVKALALVYDFPILPLNSLEVLAFRCYEASLPILSLVDAYTQEVYVGLYRFEEGQLKSLKDPTLLPYKELPKLIEEKTLFVSETLEKWEDYLSRKLGPLMVKPSFKVSLRASLLSELAWVKFKQGLLSPLRAEEVLPLYLKPSEAERKKCYPIS